MKRPATVATEPTPPIDELPRMGLRRRALIALLAVAMAVAVMFMVIEHPGGPPPRERQPPQPCVQGQTQGCVGGKADVIVVPASPPSGAQR